MFIDSIIQFNQFKFLSNCKSLSLSSISFIGLLNIALTVQHDGNINLNSLLAFIYNKWDAQWMVSSWMNSTYQPSCSFILPNEKSFKKILVSIDFCIFDLNMNFFSFSSSSAPVCISKKLHEIMLGTWNLVKAGWNS